MLVALLGHKHSMKQEHGLLFLIMCVMFRRVIYRVFSIFQACAEAYGQNRGGLIGDRTQSSSHCDKVHEVHDRTALTPILMFKMPRFDVLESC